MQRCSITGKPHLSLKGKNHDRTFKTKDAQAYPHQLCEVLATEMIKAIEDTTRLSVLQDTEDNAPTRFSVSNGAEVRSDEGGYQNDEEEGQVVPAAAAPSCYACAMAKVTPWVYPPPPPRSPATTQWVTSGPDLSASHGMDVGKSSRGTLSQSYPRAPSHTYAETRSKWRVDLGQEEAINKFPRADHMPQVAQHWIKRMFHALMNIDYRTNEFASLTMGHNEMLRIINTAINSNRHGDKSSFVSTTALYLIANYGDTEEYAKLPMPPAAKLQLREKMRQWTESDHKTKLYQLMYDTMMREVVDSDNSTHDIHSVHGDSGLLNASKTPTSTMAG